MCSTYQHMPLQQTCCQREHHQLNMCLRKLRILRAPCAKMRMWCPTVWMKVRQPRFNLKFHKLFQHSVHLKHWESTVVITEGYPMASCWCWNSTQERGTDSSGWTLFGITLKDLQYKSQKLLRPIEIRESVVCVATPIHWTDWVCAVYQLHLSCHAVDAVVRLRQFHIYCTTLPHLRRGQCEDIPEELLCWESKCWGQEDTKTSDIHVQPLHRVASGRASGLSWNLAHNSDANSDAITSPPQQSCEIFWTLLPLISFSRVLAVSIIIE